MHQSSESRGHGIDSDALLAAYQLLIETTFESVGDDIMLQRALKVLASIRWTAAHRSFLVLLYDAETAALRSAASVGAAADPATTCDDIKAAGCLCGRALVQGGRLLSVDATTAAECLPCDPRNTGMHLILPLSGRGRVLGVLHAIVESGPPPGTAEQSFLVQVASLLGAELHRRHSERERDQLEIHFLQAQKMEAVGRLAGGVAHDFNNILTAITNYADLGLLKLPAENPLRHHFEEIIAASDRAALLTQQLLAFSRHQTPTRRVIDVDAVLAELGKTLRRLLGADIELSIRNGTELVRINADPALIEQLLINLAVSARDAMPQGGAVEIATAATVLDAAYTVIHPEVAPGAYLCLTVSARGPDKAAHFRDVLGGPGRSPLEPHVGITLGPAAVNEIIHQNGGHARIETAADATTTVSICFPAVSADAAGKYTPDHTFEQLRGAETILLVEDDDSVRVVMGEVLRDLGYHVLEAREGREALDNAAPAARPIDILLTDVVLPGFGGCELHRRLAATRPGLRVLYISGVLDDPHVPMEHGAMFLRKPFSPWSLASLLRQALDAPAAPLP